MNKQLIEKTYKLMQEYPDLELKIMANKEVFDEYDCVEVEGSVFISPCLEEKTSDCETLLWFDEDDILNRLEEQVEQEDFHGEEILKEINRRLKELKKVILISFY